IAETSLDNFSGEYDFEGYRIYRSVDRGRKWDQIDRNLDPTVGADPVPIAEYDLINSIGADIGLQYTFIDTEVINGFEYWYTITAFDRGDELIESLESPRGNTIDSPNTVSLTPVAAALGRSAVSVGSVTHPAGNSNYELIVAPVDDEALAGAAYDLEFTFIARTEKGNLRTQLTYEITDITQTKAERYGVFFTATNRLDLVNLTTGEEIRTNRIYQSGVSYSTEAGLRITLSDPPDVTDPDLMPEAGDLITLNFAVSAAKDDGSFVIETRPIDLSQLQATTDGVVFSLVEPEIIQSVERVGGTDNMNLSFSVVDLEAVLDETYLVSVVDQSGNSVSLEVENSVGEIVAEFENLLSLDTFVFNGIEGLIEFPSDSAPNPGNRYSVRTIVPYAPNLEDTYRFTIGGPSMDRQAVKDNISNIRVVPNPYVVSSLYELEFGELRQEPIREIQFINLPPECTIRIFSLAGDQIKTIRHYDLTGTLSWDLRTDGGREIATGIYLYSVQAAGVEHLDRFAIIK
ncbi:MAG: hypothetical protein GY869_17625, partial [Planctomycetes bacterium]|nr:hypothetical protein [Planctomycetota bacterium]